MPKRYLGNIITDTPTAPAGPYENDAASGVWSLAEANAYTAAGLWPTAGNSLQIALFIGRGSSDGRVIEKIDFTSQGNGTNWNGLSTTWGEYQGALGSSTRGVMAGGSTSSPQDVIGYVTFATEGDASDFGDLTRGKYGVTGASNETRGIFAGGEMSYENTLKDIDYITIASTGNASDFGDLTFFKSGQGGGGSSTRAIFAGGSITTNPKNNVIDYVTIATTGNATDFGDLTVARGDLGGASSSTRLLFFGGYSTTDTNVIDYVTIATTGNATDFGDLTVASFAQSAASNNTLAVIDDGGYGSYDQVTIATTGNATNWGSVLYGGGKKGACSNAHGGLAA